MPPQPGLAAARYGDGFLFGHGLISLIDQTVWRYLVLDHQPQQMGDDLRHGVFAQRPAARGARVDANELARLDLRHAETGDGVAIFVLGHDSPAKALGADWADA